MINKETREIECVDNEHADGAVLETTESRGIMTIQMGLLEADNVMVLDKASESGRNG